MADQQQTCQFCDISFSVKYQCDDCNLLLCEICSDKIHTKLPSLLEHKVNVIKTESSDKQLFPDLKRVHCSKHNEHKCLAVCQNCDKCICSSCLVKPNEHEKLKEMYKAKCEKLKEYKTQIKEDLPFFAENAHKLEKLKEVGLKYYNDTKKQILDKEEEMKEKIAENAMALIKQVDEWWLPQKDEITKEEDKMKEAESDLKNRENNIEEALQSGRMESIMEAADLVIKDIPQKSVKEIIAPKLIKFSPESSTTEFIVGSIMTIQKLKVVKSFNSTCTSYLTIASQNEIIGYDKTTGTIKQFVLTEDNCYFTSNGKITHYGVSHIAVLQHGEILFTTNNSSGIYMCDKISEQSKKTCFKNFSIIISCVHDTKKDGKILVGYQKHQYGGGGGGIITLNREGVELEKYETELNGVKLFNKPTDISTNTNGDICAIDTKTITWFNEVPDVSSDEDDMCCMAAKTENFEGRVIVLTSWGKYKWMYQGHPDINSKHTFSPRGITTTSSGEILVSDQKTNMLHMLSTEGVFITSIGEPDGIIEPTCLVTDPKDRILVGCSGKIIILKVLK